MTHSEISLLRKLKSDLHEMRDGAEKDRRKAVAVGVPESQYVAYCRGQRDGFDVAIACIQRALDGRE